MPLPPVVSILNRASSYPVPPYPGYPGEVKPVITLGPTAPTGITLSLAQAGAVPTYIIEPSKNLAEFIPSDGSIGLMSCVIKSG